MTTLTACFSALALMLSSTAAAQVSITPAEILRRVSEAVTPEVAFKEVRTTRLLKTPLVASGVLRYFPPNRLERETRQPVQETVVIEDRQVTIDRAGTQTVISLVAGSAAAAMVETLRAVLSGQMRELDARYKLSALGSSERWSLKLEPLAADSAILAIKLAGREATVEEIEVLERSGDKTVTLLSR